MPAPFRRYHRLSDAAIILGCKTDDLVHWAVHRELRVGLLFESDWFDPPFIMDYEDQSTQPKRLKDFSGFAYVDASYLLNVERSGTFSYNAVELPDGRKVLIGPTKAIQATLEHLFVLATDLEMFRSRVDESAVGVPQSRCQQRADELQRAAEELAKEFKKKNRKVFSKREIAIELSKSSEWADLTATRIERIVRVAW